MSVELVLKFLGKLLPSEFPLQIAFGNRDTASFSEYHEKNINGVTFKQQFTDSRGPQFPLKELFQAIRDEINQGRYVIVSLKSPGGWHMYVVHSCNKKKQEFKAISKTYMGGTLIISDVRKQIIDMQGTDILTYSI